jgi:flagellar assembly protein FliH
MAGIIKANTPPAERPSVGAVVFNFDDVTSKANAYLTEVKAEAAKILAKANADAALIRKEAERQGSKNAVDSAEKTVQTRIENQVKAQMQTALPALEQMMQQLSAERLQWQEKWEQNAVRLSVAIAQKIIRRELKQQPNITLDLVREALALAAGSQMVKVYLNPQDHAALGQQTQQIANHLSTTTPAQIAAHPDVSPGGCLVQTEFGAIDQRIESQLARIAEELF